MLKVIKIKPATEDLKHMANAKTSEKLQTLVTDFEAEETKAIAGNSAAGVRARKLLLEIKKTAAEGREEIQKLKKAAK